jgi:hypothetical protein
MNLLVSRFMVLTMALLLSMAGLGSAHAAPFVPSSDSEVVERLKSRPDATLRAQRVALASAPNQLPLAIETARRSIAQARRTGDPRELGAAQAALAPWWNDRNAPPPVRLLRATILQSRHEFDGALAELDRLAADATVPPALRAQALLTRATVRQVRGRFADAADDCATLQQPPYAALGDPLRRAAMACSLELRSLQSDPRAAARGLDALAQDAGGDPWIELLRAELAERRGDDPVAQRHFAAAAATGEVYALAAQADWLLDRGRDREALAALSRAPTDADALLLRQAIAWSRLGDPRAEDARRRLRERFEAARVRGDAPHLREEARLALDIDRDARRALALALEQWAQQREPADAVLLWRAARAAGDPAAARGALRGWLPDPARADVRLAGIGLGPDAGAVR